MNPPALGRRIAEGVIVDTALALVLRGASLAVTVAVARRLTAAEYGGVSIALTIYGVSESLTNPAIRTALLRRQEKSHDVWCVAWTLSLIRSVALAVALFFAAPTLATLWHGDESVATSLRIVGVAPFAAALGNIYFVQLQQNLRFGLTFLIDNSSVLWGAVGSLLLLLLTGSPLALALGPVIGNAVTSATTWVFISPRPRLWWSTETVKELVNFTRWLMGHQVLLYLTVTVDDLYVGRALGLAAMGAYALAWRVVNTVMNVLTRALPRMLVPAYARIQSNPIELRRVVLAALAPSACAGALVAAALILCSPDLFVLIAGRNVWTDTIPVARALTLFVFSRMASQVLLPLFESVGEVRVLAATSVVRLALMAPGLYVGGHWYGVQGVATAVSAISIVMLAAFVWLVKSRFGVALRAQTLAIVCPIIVALPAEFLGSWALHFFRSPTLRVLSGAAVVTIAFVILWEVLRKVWVSAQLVPLVGRAVAFARASVLGLRVERATTSR